MSLFEIDGLGPGLIGHPAGFPAHDVHQIVPEEEEVVQNGHHRNEGIAPGPQHQIADDIKQEQGCVQPGQPLDFQRQNAVEQHLHLRVQSGEGEEHGHVHIVHGDAGLEGKADDEVKDSSQEIKYGEPSGAPLAFQGVANVVIEQSGHGKPQNGEHITGAVATYRHKQEGNDPPHLSMENCTRVEHKQPRGIAVGEHVQEVDKHIADDNELHQIGNAEAGMFVTEAVQPAGNGLHGQPSFLSSIKLPQRQQKCPESIVPVFYGKVHDESVNIFPGKWGIKSCAFPEKGNMIE